MCAAILFFIKTNFAVMYNVNYSLTVCKTIHQFNMSIHICLCIHQQPSVMLYQDAMVDFMDTFCFGNSF